MKYIILLFTSIFIFSCSVNNSEELDRQSFEGIQEPIDNPPPPSNNSSVINVTASRIGSSGTGKDIVARNKVYILGNNSKVYYFNGSSWVREPGGGEGKRISSTSNRLLLCGNNDKIYYKLIGSSSGWTHMQGNGSSECRDISGKRNESGLPNYSVSVAGVNGSTSFNRVYTWKNSNWEYHSSKTSQNGEVFSKVFDVALNTDGIVSGRGEYGSQNGSFFYNRAISNAPVTTANSDPTYYFSWTVSLADHYDESWDIAYSPTNELWYVQPDGDIKNLHTGNEYRISNRIADRISVGNDGTVYFIDRNNKNIYKLNI